MVRVIPRLSVRLGAAVYGGWRVVWCEVSGTAEWCCTIFVGASSEKQKFTLILRADRSVRRSAPFTPIAVHPSSVYRGGTTFLNSVNIEKCIRGKLQFCFKHLGKTVGFWNTWYGIQHAHVYV